MTDCERFENMISAFIEGELSSKDKSSMERHIKNCARCANIVQGIGLIKENLRKLQKVTTSPDFDIILRTRIRVEADWSQRRFGGILSKRPLGVTIPLYGLTFTVLLIAFILILKPHFITQKEVPPLKPSPFSISQWYGAETLQDSLSGTPDYLEQVHYVLEQMPLNFLLSEPETLLQSTGQPETLTGSTDTSASTNRINEKATSREIRQVRF